MLPNSGTPCESRYKAAARSNAREEGPRGVSREAEDERRARSEAKEQGGTKKEERGEEGEQRQGRSKEGGEGERRRASFGFAKYKVLLPMPWQHSGLAAFSMRKCGQTTVL